MGGTARVLRRSRPPSTRRPTGSVDAGRRPTPCRSAERPPSASSATSAAALELRGQLPGHRRSSSTADGTGGTHAGLVAGWGDHDAVLGVDVGTRPDLDDVVPREAVAAAALAGRPAPTRHLPRSTTTSIGDGYGAPTRGCPRGPRPRAAPRGAAARSRCTPARRWPASSPRSARAVCRRRHDRVPRTPAVSPRLLTPRYTDWITKWPLMRVAPSGHEPTRTPEVRAAVDAYVDVRRRIEAGDATWLDLAAFFTDDAVYVDPAWGRIQGIDEIRSFLVESMRGLEDWRFPIRFTAIDGDEVVTVWTRCCPGQRPDGRRFRQTGVSLLQYAGDGRSASRRTSSTWPTCSRTWRRAVGARRAGFASPPTNPDRDVTRPTSPPPTGRPPHADDGPAATRSDPARRRRRRRWRHRRRRRGGRRRRAHPPDVGRCRAVLGGRNPGRRGHRLRLRAHPQARDLPHIPGLALDSVVTVESATAPDDIAGFTPVFIDGGAGHGGEGGRSERHDQRAPPLPPRVRASRGTCCWMPPTRSPGMPSDQWTVDIQRAEVHVVAPWELEGRCAASGPRAAPGGCELREVEPGHLVTKVEDLAPGEGVTVRAERGAALAATPNVPPPPTTAPPDPGIGLLVPALAGGHGQAWAARCPRRCSSAARGVERVGIGGSPTRPSPWRCADERGAARRSRPGRDGHHRLRAAHRAHPSPGRPAPRREGATRSTRWPG